MKVTVLTRNRPARGRSIVPVLAIAAVAVAGASPGAAAQDAADAGVRLTLDQAVALAEANNPAYRRTANSLELNALEETEAWLQLLPRPQFSLLSTTMSWNLQRVGTDPFGNPLPNPEAQMVQSSQSRQQAALGFSFNVADYMSFRNRGAAGAMRRVSAADHLHELHSDVSRTFLNVQQQQITAALEADLLDRRVLHREAARRLYALAQRERIDLLEADLDVAVQEQQLRQSRATLSTALLELRNVIGDPGIEVAGVVPIPFRELDPAGLDDDALVRAALESNPGLDLQEAEIDLARQRITETRWQQWMPSLSVGVSASRSELARDGGGAFLEVNPSGGWDRNITIGLTFPDLGRYFDTRNRQQRQHIELRNADETLRERRLRVEQSVRAALVDLRNAHTSVDLQERRVALAEERLATRLESYRLGRGTYQELQSATDAVADAERALLASRFQMEGALIALERTLAIPIATIARLGGT